MARVAQSYWFMLLVAVAIVLTSIHAITAQPPNALNWLGVALWVLLLVTLVQRHRRAAKQSRQPARRRRRR